MLVRQRVGETLTAYQLQSFTGGETNYILAERRAREMANDWLAAMPGVRVVSLATSCTVIPKTDSKRFYHYTVTILYETLENLEEPPYTEQ